MNTFTYTQRFSARVFAAVALLSLVAGLVPMQAFAVNNAVVPSGVLDGNTQVDICHNNNGASDYSLVQGKVSAIIGETNAGHPPDDSHGGDIIPPFQYDLGNGVQSYSGRNWGSGEATFKNNCVIPTPPAPEATLTLVKNVSGGAANANSWTLAAAGPTNISGVSGAGTVTNAKVTPGAYTLSESGTVANYTNGATYSCVKNGGQAVSSNSLTLADKDTATCTITNTYVEPLCTDSTANNQGQPLPCTYDTPTGSITIMKNTADASGDIVDFPFTSQSESIGNFNVLGNENGGNGDYETFEVPVGSHTITETDIADWSFGSVSCTELGTDVYTGFVAGASNVTLSVADGDNITCVFTNTKDVVDDTTITFEKVTNVESQQTFSFYIGDSAVAAATLAGGQTSSAVTVTPGYLSINEGDAQGWTLTNVSCVDELDAPVDVNEDGVYYIDVAAGDDLTCTFTNTKDVIPDPVCENPNAQNYGEKAACIVYASVCTDRANLLTNGSFEDPVVTNGNLWDIFPAITGWVTTNGVELWKGILNGPSDGLQNAELDTTMSSAITQTVATIPGATYELRFDFAARSDASSASENSIVANADATNIASVSTDNTAWVTYGGTFVADASTDITFTDMGASNGVGTILDDAVLCLVSLPEDNDDDELSCSISASDTSIRRGRDVTINWSAVGASSASITNIDGEILLPGSKLIENLGEDTTYTMTVYGDYIGDSEEREEATCSVSVDTRSGGGGGGGTRVDRDGEVLGESTPEPLVLGEQVDAVPVGAPDAGAGGTALPSFGMTWSAILTLASRRHG